jgi:hypothetical protein
MTITVSLKDIVEAIDLPNREWQSYLDTSTGEIILITDDDFDFLDDEDDEAGDSPDWEVEEREKAKLVNEQPDRFLPLPDSFDVHEWDMMRRFAQSVPNSADGDELSYSLHGSGAFRHFKATVERLGLREAWFAFRQAEFEQLARDWLDERGIAYIEQAV